MLTLGASVADTHQNMDMEDDGPELESRVFALETKVAELLNRIMALESASEEVK